MDNNTGLKLEKQNGELLEITDAISFKKAGVFARALAFFVDSLAFQMVIILPIMTLLSKFNIGIMNTIGPLMIVALLIMTKDIFGGASVGKRLMNLVVLDNTTHEVCKSKKRLIVRNLLTVVWIIELIAILVRKDHRKIFDSFANTDVFVNPQTPQKYRAIKVITALALSFIIMFCSISLLVIKNDESYKVATALIQKDQVIRKFTGGVVGFGYFPQGSISILGNTKTSELQITVKGKKRDLILDILMLKVTDNQWKLMFKGENNQWVIAVRGSDNQWRVIGSQYQ